MPARRRLCRRLAVSSAVAVIALIALIAGAAPVAAQPPLPGERIAAGVTAAGTDVSGLTADEAAARLNEIHGARLESGIVTVQAADITWTLRTADAMVQFDELQSAKRALYAGRDAHGAPVDVPLAVAYAKDAVEKFAASVDKRLYRPARDATLRISLRKASAPPPRRGRDIDRRQLVRDIAARLTNPNLDRVLKPRLLATKPKVTADKLRA